MENTSIFEHFRAEELISISDLNIIRDSAYEINKIYLTDYSETRNTKLNVLIMDCVKLIDQNLANMNILNKHEISFLYFTKSMLLDKLPEYSKQAEESASKSLKLNPFNADNYNCIAHIIWKKKDIDSAIKYYERALEIDPKNKTSLRSLSMIVRSKELIENDEKKAASKLSLEYAKKAIEVDIKDSESWCKYFILFEDVYGNSFFYKAFVENTQYDDLNYALKAYTQAEKMQKNFRNPDLYYNRAVVHSYLENYNEAYKDFISSHEIDTNLKADSNAENIFKFASLTSKFIKNKCSIKPKKLSQLLSTIPTNLKEDISYSLQQVSSLSYGENNNKIISAKIIQPVDKIFEVPLSLICVDNDAGFFCLSIYNVNKTFLENIKFFQSTAVILDPVYKAKCFNYGDKAFEFPCIQVGNLSKLLIDGKFCGNFTTNSLLNSKFFN